jgi:molybdate/tungstate transport system substrate-binding protein
MRPSLPLSAAVLSGLLLAACTGNGANGATPSVVVSYAGSLARPFAGALAEYSRRSGVRVTTQTSGSVEAARRITELDDVPDVIALADEEVFTNLLVPVHVESYRVFARNRMVIAYTPTSRHAAEIDSTNWYRLLSRDDVEVGRSDPALDPNGYRAILVLRLAEGLYHQPGLEQRVLARAPARNVRPKSADLVALLQTGALDYAFAYESVARSAGLRWLRLPAAIDLSDESRAADYTRVSLRIPGATQKDSIVVTGTPIRYAIAIPRRAPHPAEGERLRDFLLSPAGRKLLTDGGLDVVEDTARAAASHHPATP